MIVTLLCDRCRRHLGPRKPRPPLATDTLHGHATTGMVRAPDARAEAVKRRKERKATRTHLRAVLARDGLVAAAKVFLSAKRAGPPVSEECEDCLALMAARRAA